MTDLSLSGNKDGSHWISGARDMVITVRDGLSKAVHRVDSYFLPLISKSNFIPAAIVDTTWREALSLKNDPTAAKLSHLLHE